ncbi:hypothetical protein [Bacterioplanoides sp. SCSIO 12839]|uniref:hypothetical protein n=1 Tax=Bacterioplanoides sp. SCSIO 12839 TaxID=2829569 RepID=UPI0021083CBB|nr:hypothetical protein [Bacterioplanoides sp. SCSIO 12839]UTW48406.1 hypothetical protein KFF03_00410 [Bacterioplanoides sp. SCSIO 12839]
MKLSLLLSVLVLLSACSTSGKSQEPAETIFGYRWQGNLLFVEVTSHGCTTTEDFSLVWKEDLLLLQRDTPDRCRRMPFVTTLNFETKRIPGQFVTLENPVKEKP